MKRLMLAALVGAIASEQAVLAAPGEIAQYPLNEASGVTANMLVILDDSGSMLFEDLPNAGVGFSDSIAQFGGILEYRELEISKKRNVSFEDIHIRRELPLLLCRGYNVLAYDPGISYLPWEGYDPIDYSKPILYPYKKKNDKVYNYAFLSEEIYNESHQVIELYYPGVTLELFKSIPIKQESENRSINLSDAAYVLWEDGDEDGAFDLGECGGSNPNWVEVKSLSNDEQQNYSNWFHYYRKREFVAKGALAEVLSDTRLRIGFQTINDEAEEEIDYPDAERGGNGTHREDVLETLTEHSMFFNGNTKGTPLRRALKAAGESFRESGDDAPILSADDGGMCQQNYALLTTDGFWNGGDPGVGDVDGGHSNISLNNTSTTLSDLIGPSYSDDASNTLADVAMAYYAMDLRPDLEDLVATRGRDINPAQHMVTYGLGFGVNGTLSNGPSGEGESFDWPEPSPDDPTTIDDLRHAAWNGRGSFLSATSPEALVQSLKAIESDIVRRSAVVTGVTSTESSQVNDGARILKSLYSANGWWGDVNSVAVLGEDGNGNILLDETAAWSAADQLAEQVAGDGHSERYIITDDGNGNAFEFKAIDDVWNRLSDLQRSDLLSVAPNDAVGAREWAFRFINWLRGDDTYEGAGLRNRHDELLGDFIGSRPVVAGPSRSAPDRKRMVYIGGNDGMLHGFDYETGEEKLAFIPSAVFAEGDNGLHALADIDYSHRYYVDGEVYIAEAEVGGETRLWLTSTLGAGGRGVFALDISDPESFGESQSADAIFAWQFTHEDDPDLGYTYGEAHIVELNDGNPWVLVGNGYNADGGDGNAKLFLLSLAGPGSDGWDLGSDYYKIDTRAGDIDDDEICSEENDCNGLSPLEVVDLQGDGKVDLAYAGDLQGNLWAFDLSSQFVSEWDKRRLFTSCDDDECDDDDDRQSITAKPAVYRNERVPGTSYPPNLMVYFGTGSLLTEEDLHSSQRQSFYAVWDAGEEVDKEDLVEQELKRVTEDGIGYRYIDGDSVEYLEDDGDIEDQGWFLDIDVWDGERLITEPVPRRPYITFNTFAPNDDLCSGGGRSALMALDLFGGAAAPPKENDAPRRPEEDYHPDGDGDGDGDGGEAEVITREALDTDGDGGFDEDDRVDGKSVSGIEVDTIATSPSYAGSNRITGIEDGLDIRKTNFDRANAKGRVSWYQLR